MNDLELMYLLKENGYEASAENLAILKEELAQEANGPELEKASELKNKATLEKAPKELTADIDNEDIYGDDEEAAEDVGEVVIKEDALKDYYKSKAKQIGGGKKWKDVRGDEIGSAIKDRILKNEQSKGALDQLNNEIDAQKLKGKLEDEKFKTGKKGTKTALQAVAKQGKKGLMQKATDQVSGKAPATWWQRQKAKFRLWKGGHGLAESVTDMDILNYLNENGYVADLENLLILKEALNEDVYSDYELYQLLEANGYTTTEKNLEILKEGLITGDFIIE